MVQLSVMGPATTPPEIFVIWTWTLSMADAVCVMVVHN